MGGGGGGVGPITTLRKSSREQRAPTRSGTLGSGEKGEEKRRLDFTLHNQRRYTDNL